MLGFLKSKKRGPVNQIDQERIANAIVSRFIRLQVRWAACMQHASEKLSNRSKKMVIMLFCLLAFTFSVYLMVDSLTSKVSRPIELTSIRLPKNIMQNLEEKIHSPATLPESDYRKIVRFRFYMDSLIKTEKGRLTSDSLIRARPGLMDSISQLEKLYHLQLTNKK